MTQGFGAPKGRAGLSHMKLSERLVWLPTPTAPGGRRRRAAAKIPGRTDPGNPGSSGCDMHGSPHSSLAEPKQVVSVVFQSLELGDWLISPLAGEMPGKAEGGAVPPASRPCAPPSGLPPISPARGEISQSPNAASLHEQAVEHTSGCVNRVAVRGGGIASAFRSVSMNSPPPLRASSGGGIARAGIPIAVWRG